VDSSDVGNNRENLVQVHICATACKRTWMGSRKPATNHLD
jgi:hypothetical protein